jgi:tRNA G46 methylase TrmB
MNHKENYKRFYKDFGGAARTKTSRRSPIFGHLMRQLLQASGLKNRRQNLRVYDPPFFSKLPKGFIRLDPWEIEYLYMIASRAKTGILEIGRLRGGSTFVLASANQTVPIYSIDIDPKNDVELRRLFKEHGIGSNVELITGDSQKPLYPGIEKFDVL